MNTIKPTSNYMNPYPGHGLIRVGIAGGAGYTGGELIRLLLHHPNVEITFIHSTSNAGKLVYEVHHDLMGDTAIRFTNELSNTIDVLFLCLGHGEARKFLEANTVADYIRIIDLSNDFRLLNQSQFGTRNFIYGLPELNKDQIALAQHIANPGCFATAIQLGLLPLAKAGLLKDIYATGITGSTGAGQSLSATAHFSWRASNIQAYKSLTHQHVNEIHQSLHHLQEDFPVTTTGDKGVHFVPWRGDFTRGIYVSSTLHCDLPLEQIIEMYKTFYADTYFTHLSDTMIDLKQVLNTNKCLIHIEKQGTKIVIHSAIDNLLKGACGQAVQNMNLMLGVEETAGLKLKASGF